MLEIIKEVHREYYLFYFDIFLVLQIQLSHQYQRNLAYLIHFL